jgi:DNA-binding transcriptional regulator YiaG
MKVNLGNAEGSRPWYTRAHHHVQQEVGRRIRELRSFDMTQAEFDERIGISQNYLPRWNAACVFSPPSSPQDRDG